MITHIKALRWISLKLDLPFLTVVQSQAVSDFLKSQSRIPFERSEATPIPLAVLAAWEQRILSDDCPPIELITLGCFLIATMASLRFRDLLRTKPQSLSIQGHILRGISWKTKTSVSGQPWGVCCLGIVTRPTAKHWAFRFLEALQFCIERSREHWGPQWEPDFLLPSWTDSIPFSSPCSYQHALALARYYTQCSWLQPQLLSPDQAFGLSTHSMKTTLLAAAGQLNLNLDSRAKQGHHKKSVQLYSRDDVWPSLFLQRDILLEISSGWRPMTSQARGAKQPLPEPIFFSPPISQEDLQLVQLSLPKTPTPASSSNVPTSTNQEPNGDDSDQQGASISSSSSSSSSESDENNNEDASDETSLMIMNEKSHIVHAARMLRTGLSLIHI